MQGVCTPGAWLSFIDPKIGRSNLEPTETKKPLHRLVFLATREAYDY